MPVRLNTTQHLGSQHLGLPLAFGKLLLSTRWSRAEVRGAGVSEVEGSYAHRTQPRSFLMTAPKIKALFYLFTANVFNSVQVPRGAPGPATSQHGPSLMAKLKQSDTGAVFGLQELCQVGKKKLFFPLFFLYHWEDLVCTHTSGGHRASSRCLWYFFCHSYMQGD